MTIESKTNIATAIGVLTMTAELMESGAIRNNLLRAVSMLQHDIKEQRELFFNAYLGLLASECKSTTLIDKLNQRLDLLETLK